VIDNPLEPQESVLKVQRDRLWDAQRDMGGQALVVCLQWYDGVRLHIGEEAEYSMHGLSVRECLDQHCVPKEVLERMYDRLQELSDLTLRLSWGSVFRHGEDILCKSCAYETLARVDPIIRYDFTNAKTVIPHSYDAADKDSHDCHECGAYLYGGRIKCQECDGRGYKERVR